MISVQPAGHLAWHRAEVDGRRVSYGVAGEGPPLLFMHGWGVSGRTYRRALERLVDLGHRVYAPDLPGFGGSMAFGGSCDLASYAAWADRFLDALGVCGAVSAVGHSFGGAIAAKLAHDFPGRVERLVLVNSVGGSWKTSAGGAPPRPMADRPLWDWAVCFPRDIFFDCSAPATVAVILREAVPNLLLNAASVWRTAGVARRADVLAELHEISKRAVPVTVLWGERDGILPRACFDAICRAAGCTGDLVPGRHSWLLSDPEAFAAAMARSFESTPALGQDGRARRRARAS